MKNAALHGADMVEFDVQLSQDLIPVVYHDFELLASIVNKKGDQQMMVQMPLKNLTLDQLQQLKVSTKSDSFPKDKGSRGSGCGAVDSAVASDTRGRGFESIHRQL